MKKIMVLLLLTVLLRLLGGCEFPVAQGQTQPPQETVHIHTITQSRVVRPLSCTTDELTAGYCACGQYMEQVSQRAPGSHQFREDSCIACGATLGTDLEFRWNQDTGSYTVVGMGECKTAYLVIPDTVDGKPVTAIGPAAFFGQKELQQVEVPEGIVSIGQAAFSDTLTLHTVLLPYSLKTVDTLAFSECWNLKEIYLPASVQFLGENALLSHGVLENIHVSFANPWFSSMDGVLFDRKKTALLSYPSGRQQTHYTVPSTVKTIGDHAFQRSDHLVTVELPDQLEIIGSSSFYLCRGLKSVDFKPALREIGNEAFSYCRSLEKVDLPEGVTVVGDAAFSGCFQLEIAWVPNSVTKLGRHAFSNCTALKRLTIGSGVRRLPDNLCAMSTSLEVLTVAMVREIGKNALFDCFGLLEIRFAGTIEQWEQVKKGQDWDSSVGRYTVQCKDGAVTYRPEKPEET